MTPLKKEFKKARAGIGTIVSLHVTTSMSETEVLRALDSTFDELVRLEKIFSVHNQNSSLNQFNDGAGSTDPDLMELVSFALTLENFSAGAFNPSRDGRTDLSGVAKGYIVDRLVFFLRKTLPDAAGVVNAGGDLRYFGDYPRRAHLRVGTSSQPKLQQVEIAMDALATSNWNAGEWSPGSSTLYSQVPADALRGEGTVVAVAPTCAAADGLTKVGLFGKPKTIEECCKALQGSIFIFDRDGELRETYGQP